MARNKRKTDDFLLDQVDRTQRHRTRRRREGRFYQRRVYLLGAFLMIALAAVGAPSFVSHSPLGRSLVSQAAARQGVSLDTESVRVGWMTPLRLSGIQIHSQSEGNHFRIDQIDCPLTVTDLLRGNYVNLGQVSIRGVDVHCTMHEGRCSLEDDLATLLQPNDSADAPPTCFVSIQDISVAVTDIVTGKAWQVAQSNAEIDLQQHSIVADFAGVLSEPSGDGGSLQGSISVESSGRKETRIDSDQVATDQAQAWSLSLDTETLPLSVVSLIRRRFPDSASSIPQSVVGNATGAIKLIGLADGTVATTTDRLSVRHLQAADPTLGNRVWSNQSATISGDLTLTPQHVVGRNLYASTDFASVQLDGSFARTMTLIGANDNPLSWLDAIDGSASMQIDLAAFDQALPGVIPLRHETQIVSGRATASIESIPDGEVRRSKLVLRTDPLRASTRPPESNRSRTVVIEPVELKAVVSRNNQHLNADRFQWSSSFGSVTGHGNLQSGAADLEIDFGRLESMLRPIIEFSETGLDGLARGNIRWNASGNNLWKLTGTGSATNVQITLPGGQQIRQASVQSDINATGRWGNGRLDELTDATIQLVSGGIDARVQLADPVRNPSPESPISVRVQSSGRLEAITDAFGHWMPSELHNAEGAFDASLYGSVSTIAANLSRATIEIDQPRIAYGHRWFEQPNLKIHFDGSLNLPSGNIDARSFTLAGDAISAGIRGVSNEHMTALEIAWRAKLERIQGSVRKRMANRQNPPFSRVGYRSGKKIESDEWLVMGDFNGKLLINGNATTIELENSTVGKDVAIVQPPGANADARTIGPMPRQIGRAIDSRRQQKARVVWSEPNLKLDGKLTYHRATGRVDSESVQIAGDWFATTLSGGALVSPAFRAAKFAGPARLKMHEVASRLSHLTGTQIQAEGIQETPLDIEIRRGDDGAIALIIDGRLGWEYGEVAGVQFGESTIPFRLTETSVKISPCVIPVGQGQLNIAGDVFYRPGPVWMRLQPGVVARSVRITPEMTDRWLKYLAPLAADAARVDGTFSAEIDEAMIIIDDPHASRASGRMNIEGVQMTAGPLTQQIIGGIDQLKALSKSIPNVNTQANEQADSSTKLITMPPQTVDFLLDRNVVSHKTIFFDIDRARLLTSGQVGLDGRLSMIAQVELDRRWLGNDLQGLAGQAVSLPVAGTLSRPRLDSSGVRQVVTQLAAQTVQSAGETFLKKQLEKSEDYINDQIGRGLDKLFGR